MTARASALALLAVMALVLTDALLPMAPLRLAARCLLVAFVLLEWRRMALNAKVMVAIAGLGCAGLPLLVADPGPAVARSLDSGAFLATFFASQFFLKEAARGSPLVRRCSTFFVNQRPARRYALLTLGGYLFGIILNVGVLSLLGIMITRRNSLQAAGGSEELRLARERRMAMALLRGFSVTPLASPLSIALAVVTTALPELHWSTLLPLGILTGALVLGCGCLQDWIQAPRHLAPLVPPMESDRDIGALLGVSALVLGVFFLAAGIESAIGIPLSRAIVVSIPLVGLGWQVRQYADYGPLLAARLTGRRVVREAGRTFPNYRTEIAILGGAGVIGTLVAAAAPPELLGRLLGGLAAPPAVLAPALLLVVALPAFVGINPIVTVTIVASVVHAMAAPPLAPQVVALALLSGWVLAVNCSALTASAMLLGDILKRPPGLLTVGWNGGFSLVLAVILAAWVALLTLIGG